jgi:hypothetical protein
MHSTIELGLRFEVTRAKAQRVRLLREAFRVGWESVTVPKKYRKNLPPVALLG